jgi:hypothetical protein
MRAAQPNPPQPPAASGSARGPSAEPKAAPGDGKAQIAAEVQRQLDAASTRHGAMTDAERERAVTAGEAHLRRVLFKGSEAAFTAAKTEIEAMGHKVDGAMLAHPRTFKRVWLTARGGA